MILTFTNTINIHICLFNFRLFKPDNSSSCCWETAARKISDSHSSLSGELSSGNKLVYFVARPISVECLDSLSFQRFSPTKLIYGRYCNQSAPERGSKSCHCLAATERIHQTRGWRQLTHTHTHTHTPQAAVLHACTSTHKHTRNIIHFLSFWGGWHILYAGV